MCVVVVQRPAPTSRCAASSCMRTFSCAAAAAASAPWYRRCALASSVCSRRSACSSPPTCAKTKRAGGRDAARGIGEARRACTHARLARTPARARTHGHTHPAGCPHLREPLVSRLAAAAQPGGLVSDGRPLERRAVQLGLEATPLAHRAVEPVARLRHLRRRFAHLRRELVLQPLPLRLDPTRLQPVVGPSHLGARKGMSSTAARRPQARASAGRVKREGSRVPDPRKSGIRLLVARMRELRRCVALGLLRARRQLVARLGERRLTPQRLRVPPLHLELEPLAVARLPVYVGVVGGACGYVVEAGPGRVQQSFGRSGSLSRGFEVVRSRRTASWTRSVAAARSPASACCASSRPARSLRASFSCRR